MALIPPSPMNVEFHRDSNNNPIFSKNNLRCQLLPQYHLNTTQIASKYHDCYLIFAKDLESQLANWQFYLTDFSLTVRFLQNIPYFLTSTWYIEYHRTEFQHSFFLPLKVWRFYGIHKMSSP
jgi:hypothetical protein